MNIGANDIKLVEPLQGTGDGTSQGAIKTATDNKGSSFKDLFNQFSVNKGLETTTQTTPEKDITLNVDKSTSDDKKNNISLNLPLTIGKLKQLVSKMNVGRSTNAGSDTQKLESDMGDLINQLLISIKSMNANTDANKKQPIGNNVNVDETKDNNVESSTKTDALGKIALVLNMISSNASQGLNSGDGTSANTSSMEQLLPMLMLMLTKGDLPSTGNTSDTKVTDNSSLNKALALIQNSLNGITGTSITSLGGEDTNTKGEAPLSGLDNSNLLQLLFSNLGDISASTSVANGSDRISQLTKLRDTLTKIVGVPKQSGSEQDKTDVAKLGEMLNNISSKVKQSEGTGNGIDQTKLGEDLKGIKEKLDSLSNKQDKTDIKALSEMLNNIINQVKQSASTGNGMDQTKLGEDLKGIKEKLNSLSNKQDKTDIEALGEMLSSIVSQVNQSQNTGNPIDSTTKTEVGNSGLSEQTLLKVLQELTREVGDKKKNTVDLNPNQSTPTTEIIDSQLQKDNPQGSNKLEAGQSSNTAGDISNSLSNIIEVVKQKITTREGKITPDNLRQAYKELVDELQFSKLNENGIVIQNQPDINAQKGITLGAGATPTPTPVNSEQTFKNQIVNILVLLSSEGNANTAGNKKIDNIKKFTTLLDTQINNKLPEEKTVIKAVDGNLQGSKNQEGFKSQAESTSLSKEDKILRSAAKISDDDGKVTKVNNFISQISNRPDIKSDTPTEKPVINRITFNQDIIKAVKYMNSNGIKELSVKISPGEMGEITIKLTMDQGNVKANITANTKDTYNLLNSNLNDLTNQLGSSDIKINSLDINVYQEDTTFFNQNNNKEQQRSNSGNRRNNNFESTDEIGEIGNKEEDGNISALV